ncbi:hypothetical protein TNCV_1420261 [Trichonephila clavipes]|nr:hypothetical protein TNCV_1420261 [Trichonephila clavipes]
MRNIKGNNIERLFDEARGNMQKQHKSWEKHYNLRRRDVHIKVNDLVLLQTHFLSAAAIKRSKICKKRSLTRSDHQTGKDTLLRAKAGSQESIPSLDLVQDLQIKNPIPLHQEYSPLQVHQSCLIAGMLRLQVGSRMKLVDVITRPVRPERQREDTTNKRRKQSGRIKPIQEDLCPYYLRSRIQEKTESMRPQQHRNQRHTWQHIPQKKPQYGSVEWRSSA